MKDHWNYDRAVLRRTDIAETEVVDPHQPPGQTDARITVLRTLRDDPLARLWARDQIDRAQYLAGRLMQRLYEMAAIGSLKAIDTTKEPVDGGKLANVASDAQSDAINRIEKLELVMGITESIIVRNVLGDGMFLADVAAARGLYSDRGRRALARVFRGALEKLAKELKYA